MFKLLCVLCVFSLVGCSNFQAQDNRGLKGRALIVYVEGEGSDCEPRVIAPFNECEDKEYARDAKADDICHVKRNKWLGWWLVGQPADTDFKIVFSGEGKEENPFKDGCGDLTSQNNILRCRIDREAKKGHPYGYSIKVNNCENPLDPRVWVY